MSYRKLPYPVIDVFAGPGGLGEGFASYMCEKGSLRFQGALSMERDYYAHQTLLLRHFLHAFQNEYPDSYYHYLQGSLSISDLYERHKKEYEKAEQSALRVSLGPETHGIVREAIEQRLKKKKHWILVGGPPCQAYSLVGRSRRSGDPEFEQDERHFLYREYLRIIADHNPPVFVMENVKGLLSARISGERMVNKIIKDLSSPGAALGNKNSRQAYTLYSLSTGEVLDDNSDPKMFVVKAEEYGVPQARHRMFVVGVRNDFKVRPAALKKQNVATVSDVIGDLPAVRSGLSKGIDNAENWRQELNDFAEKYIALYRNDVAATDMIERLNDHIINCTTPESRSSVAYRYNKKAPHPVCKYIMDHRLGVLTGHESRGHMGSDIQRYMFSAVFAQVAKRSPRLGDFPDFLIPAHKNADLGRAGKMFSDRFKVQLPDTVSSTITSHISKDGHYFIHYDPVQCRSLTVREAARLQTFPDNYKFEGPRTEQYRQIGNAVPPYLARQIAEIMADLLDSVSETG